MKANDEKEEKLIFEEKEKIDIENKEEEEEQELLKDKIKS